MRVRVPPPAPCFLSVHVDFLALSRFSVKGCEGQFSIRLWLYFGCSRESLVIKGPVCLNSLPALAHETATAESMSVTPTCAWLCHRSLESFSARDHLKHDESRETGDLLVCDLCVGDSIIRQRIRSEGRVGRCDFCSRTRKRRCISISELSEVVRPVFEANYRVAQEEPHFSVESDNVEYRAEGESAANVVSEILEIDYDVGEGVAEYLDESTYVDIKHGEEPFFGREEGYEETPVSDYEYQELWESFCNSVQHDTRFFNEHAIGILKGIFDGIKSGKLEDGRSPIYEIGRGTRIDSVFRARVVRSGADMLRFVNNPSKELGPPPKNIATAGRMNPAGVSVFYGALDEHTCIAELRLAVGESAVVGKFRIARKLRVLDFTRFKEFQGPVSMFDPAFSSVISQRKFLRRFRHEISRPIRPTDQENSYVPTQAVAEYLAKIHEPPIDALIYPSAQTKEGDQIGSCTLVSIRDAKYFLTAAHVIDEREHFPLYVGGSDLIELELERGSFWSTKKPANDRQKDHYDFAVWKMPDDFTARLGNVAYIPSTQLVAEDRMITAHHNYVALGYPNSRNKKLDYPNKGVLPVAWKYSSMAKPNAELAGTLGISGQDHLFLDFDRQHSKDADGHVVNSVRVRGAGGGALIDMGVIARADNLERGTKCDSRLAGILIEQPPSHKAIVALKIALVFRRIGVQM